MKSLIGIFLFFSITILSAQNNSSALNIKHFNQNKTVAIEGYDAVSYFAGSKPTKGKSSIQATFGGVVYYFSTTKHKDLFLQNPEIYLPQYGGWCAYAMGANGEKVEVNPETFKIVNGKLYLFYNAFFNNTLTDWNKNEAALKAKADKNWKSIFK